MEEAQPGSTWTENNLHCLCIFQTVFNELARSIALKTCICYPCRCSCYLPNPRRLRIPNSTRQSGQRRGGYRIASRTIRSSTSAGVAASSSSKYSPRQLSQVFIMIEPSLSMKAFPASHTPPVRVGGVPLFNSNLMESSAIIQGWNDENRGRRCWRRLKNGGRSSFRFSCMDDPDESIYGNIFIHQRPVNTVAGW